MTHSQILSENASSKRVLANLSLAIDEARLVRRIVDMSDNVNRIKNQPESASRATFLRNEIARLELELIETRLIAESNAAF